MSHPNLKYKRGAIELSIGTVVIIVLAMSMLILGLVLIRNIFTGATESVNILDDKVQNEIKNLFNDENSNVIVKLGSDRTAKIKPGTSVKVGIGARLPSGEGLQNENRLKYTLTLDELTTSDNCLRIMGKTRTENLFITNLNVPVPFLQIDGPNAFGDVEVNVPKGTPICTQKVIVKVTDTQDSTLVGQTFFSVEILKESLL